MLRFRLIAVSTAIALLAFTAAAIAEDTAPAAGSASAPTAAAPPTPPFGTVTQMPFEESTTLLGKADAGLEGVWFLIAYAEVAPGKFKTFPQLLKVVAGAGGPEFHILDVRLPPEIEREIREAGMRTLAKWVPSAQVLETLRANWSQLAPAKEKNLEEFLFAKIEYTLAAPDSYAQAFPQRDAVMEKVLQGSKWTLKIAETYRPRDLPPDTRIAQLIQRMTIYGAATVSANEVRGPLSFGLVAAGAGTPLPFSFGGDFVLYRLATP